MDEPGQSQVLQPRLTPWFRRVWNHLRLVVQTPFPRYAVEYEMQFPRLLSARLRQSVVGDAPACRELYAINAPGRFPTETVRDHEAYLASNPAQKLVVEVDGRVVGCGGYQLVHPNYATFVYGLVHPRYQKVGVGRLLMFGRIAQLPIIETRTAIAICAVQTSLPYYHKYGFKVVDAWEDSSGEKHPVAALFIDAEVIRRAQNYLKVIGVPAPDLTHLPADDLGPLTRTSTDASSQTQWARRP